MLAVFGIVVVVGRGGGWRRIELVGVSWSLGGREKAVRREIRIRTFRGCEAALGTGSDLFRRGADQQMRLARGSPDRSPCSAVCVPQQSRC